jgi:hypothetical protein
MSLATKHPNKDLTSNGKKIGQCKHFVIMLFVWQPLIANFFNLVNLVRTLYFWQLKNLGLILLCIIGDDQLT